MPDLKLNLSITRRKLLLVEGEDEENFFEALLQHLKLNESVQVISVGGITKFGKKFPVVRRAPGFSDLVSIGFARDAEADSGRAFQSICEVIRSCKPEIPFPLPDQPGRCAIKDHLRCGVIIIPPGKEQGNIEDLCLESVAGTPRMCCVDAFIDCLKRQAEFDPTGRYLGASNTFPRNLSKARTLAFLASHPEDITRLGHAARKDCWPMDGQTFEPVRKFLVDLFA